MRSAAALLPLAALALGAFFLGRLVVGGGGDDPAVPTDDPVPDASPAAEPGPATTPGLAPRPAPIARADLAPTRDPLPLATEYLLACQDADGWFRAARGVAAEDAPPAGGGDAALTGLATLVLLDAADPVGDAREAVAARRALEAIVAGSVGGRLAPEADVEGQATLCWALAAGYAHTARPRWAPAVKAAVAHLLATAHEDGGWRARGGDDADHLLATSFAAGALHEALTLTETVADPGPLVEAIERAGAFASSLSPETVARLDPGARSAWALLLRAIDVDQPPIRPEEVLRPLPVPGREAFSIDPAGVLWGTVHRWLGGDLEAWRAWESGAVVPALARQRLEGPARGSWDPGDARSRRRGRAWATALQTLSWVVVHVEFRPPRGT